MMMKHEHELHAFTNVQSSLHGGRRVYLTDTQRCMMSDVTWSNAVFQHQTFSRPSSGANQTPAYVPAAGINGFNSVLFISHQITTTAA